MSVSARDTWIAAVFFVLSFVLFVLSLRYKKRTGVTNSWQWPSLVLMVLMAGMFVYFVTGGSASFLNGFTHS